MHITRASVAGSGLRVFYPFRRLLTDSVVAGVQPTDPSLGAWCRCTTRTIPWNGLISCLRKLIVGVCKNNSSCRTVGPRASLASVSRNIESALYYSSSVEKCFSVQLVHGETPAQLVVPSIRIVQEALGDRSFSFVHMHGDVPANTVLFLRPAMLVAALSLFVSRNWRSVFVFFITKH